MMRKMETMVRMLAIQRASYLRKLDQFYRYLNRRNDELIHLQQRLQESPTFRPISVPLLNWLDDVVRLLSQMLKVAAVQSEHYQNSVATPVAERYVDEFRLTGTALLLQALQLLYFNKMHTSRQIF